MLNKMYKLDMVVCIIFDFISLFITVQADVYHDDKVFPFEIVYDLLALGSFYSTNNHINWTYLCPAFTDFEKWFQTFGFELILYRIECFTKVICSVVQEKFSSSVNI